MNDRLDELDLPLPPRRTLPPEVRSRVRGTVFRELDAPARTRLDRIRPPLAVAASVAVLAAGAMIVTQSVGGSGDDPLIPPTSTTAPPVDPLSEQPLPLDLATANADLDRCFAAVRSAGKTAAVPDRATWTPVFAVPGRGRTVTAVRAAGKPLFCETTRATVTVSNPNAEPRYAAGSRTGALMISKDGAVGGLADPTWESMSVWAVGRMGIEDSTSPTIIKDGLFVTLTRMSTGPWTQYSVRRKQPMGQSAPPGGAYPALDLPRGPEPLVVIADRLDEPADRTSDSGVFLGECIAKSPYAVIDADAFAPIAIIGTPPHRAVLARYGDELLGCTAYTGISDPNDPTTAVLVHQTVPAEQRIRSGNEPIQFVMTMPCGDVSTGLHREALLGVVRSDAATMELLAPGHNPIQVSVTNGTFGVLLPAPTQEYPIRPRDYVVVLRDKASNEIHRGPLGSF